MLLLLQSARARAREQGALDRRMGLGDGARPARWASCRCISPAASRPRARISRRSSPPHPKPAYTPTSSPLRSALNRARLEGLAARGLDHVQISFPDVDAENAERIGACPARAEEARRRRLDHGARSAPHRQRADPSARTSIMSAAISTSPSSSAHSGSKSPMCNITAGPISTAPP